MILYSKRSFKLYISILFYRACILSHRAFIQSYHAFILSGFLLTFILSWKFIVYKVLRLSGFPFIVYQVLRL